MDRSTRTRLVTGLVLLLVLAAGMVLGVAVDRQWRGSGLTAEGARQSEGRGSGRESGAQRPSAPDSVSRRRPLLVEQVGLSQGQKVKVDSIVAFYRSRMHALRDEFDQAYAARYQEVLTGTRNALRAILGAEQRAAYDSLLLDADRRRDERRQRDSLGGRRP
jgi:hypothetical protein